MCMTTCKHHNKQEVPYFLIPQMCTIKITIELLAVLTTLPYICTKPWDAIYPTHAGGSEGVCSVSSFRHLSEWTECAQQHAILIRPSPQGIFPPTWRLVNIREVPYFLILQICTINENTIELLSSAQNTLHQTTKVWVAIYPMQAGGIEGVCFSTINRCAHNIPY